MTHPMYRVQAIGIVARYSLCVVFDDATEQVVRRDRRSKFSGAFPAPLPITGVL